MRTIKSSQRILAFVMGAGLIVFGGFWYLFSSNIDQRPDAASVFLLISFIGFGTFGVAFLKLIHLRDCQDSLVNILGVKKLWDKAENFQEWLEEIKPEARLKLTSLESEVNRSDPMDEGRIKYNRARRAAKKFSII